ncbi:hypothetical protein SVIOM74S_04889 [Streptomyces violarus]
MLFASGFIEAGYRRFIERRLREESLEGTPIRISVRVREKRGAKRKYAEATEGRPSRGRPSRLWRCSAPDAAPPTRRQCGRHVVNPAPVREPMSRAPAHCGCCPVAWRALWAPAL